MPTYDELDALPTDELRRRAFDVAEHRHDIGFFWDLVKHLPAAASLAYEDGSPGDVVGSIAEMARMARQLTTADAETLGAAEPLFRERFITYLMEHQPPAS